MKTKFKPYDLVEVTIPCDVQGGSRTFIGQVMSYPFNDPPEIMVRRVPEHPGTLVQLSVAQLRPVLSKYKYVHYAEVRGMHAHSRFPEDMLRYDSCEPVNFKVDDDCMVLIDGSYGIDTLMIADVGSRGIASWTVDRWRSFGWTISPVKTERLP